jgi:endonuclease/exonuclease/phosphatase family metal-dependent hydrolase
MIRIATFNVENLFERAKVLNQETWAEGKPVLELFDSLSRTLQKANYTASDKQKILDGLVELGLEGDDTGPFVELRQNRGRLVKRPQAGGLEIVAGGRNDWIGWLELRKQAVNELATRNTAQVFRDVGAHVVAVVEAEHRTSLKRFNEDVLPMVGGVPYEQVMLIDGNDERGIDVGLMVRNPIAIGRMRSHVDDRWGNSRIFSRDCPEFELHIPGAPTLLVLVNHLKSKGFGSFAASNARRKLQAERVARLYDARRAEGFDHIVVLGDLNDTPDSDPLAPLLVDTDLADVSTHASFVGDGRPGTFANGTAANKIDYILLSPALFDQVASAEPFRKGVWGGVHGTLFPHYPEMTAEIHAASDHAALWVDLAIV